VVKVASIIRLRAACSRRVHFPDGQPNAVQPSRQSWALNGKNSLTRRVKALSRDVAPSTPGKPRPIIPNPQVVAERLPTNSRRGGTAVNLGEEYLPRSASNQLACGQGPSVLTRLTPRKPLKLIAMGRGVRDGHHKANFEPLFEGTQLNHPSVSPALSVVNPSQIVNRQSSIVNKAGGQ